MSAQGVTNNLITDLRNLLSTGGAATQETICADLEAKGHQVNQSKISRLLRKINAIKSKNDQGEMVYRLSHDAAPPALNTMLAELVTEVLCNESVIIIKTSPGSASLIARILDDRKFQIIGTIAGDDTIFIAPKSVRKIKETLSLVCSFLGIASAF